MATIEERVTKDGKKMWRAKIRRKGRPSISKTFERKTDAKNWAQTTESDIRQGRALNAESTRHTVDEAIDRYIDTTLTQKRSTRDQLRQLNWWKDQIGSYVLADCNPALLVECRDKLANGITRTGAKRSGSTVNRYFAALSHVFTIAVREWQWLESSPFNRISKLKEPKGRVRFLSEDERNRLIRVCQNSSNRFLYPIVLLAISTGARKGELLNLKWAHVDLDKRVIHLDQTKNEERRALHLSCLSLDVMRNLGKVRHIDSDLVFPSPHDPKKPINIENLWKAALKIADLEDFRFHDLRHTAASYLAMNGATTAEIAAVLGHKTLQMVKRYAHISEQHTAGVVERMNKNIFG